MSNTTLADMVVKHAMPADMEGLRLEEMKGWDAIREEVLEGHRLHELKLREHVRAAEWDDVFSMLGHHGRAKALVLLGPSLTRPVLRRILRHYWMLMEGVPPSDAIRLFRRAGFVADSRKRLPGGVLTIFRGVGSPRRRLGLSWTLSLEAARFFAERGRSEPGPIYTANVESSDVLAYFTTRDEAEVIVDPATLRAVRRIKS